MIDRLILLQFQALEEMLIKHAENHLVPAKTNGARCTVEQVYVDCHKDEVVVHYSTNTTGSDNMSKFTLDEFIKV